MYYHREENQKSIRAKCKFKRVYQGLKFVSPSTGYLAAIPRIPEGHQLFSRCHSLNEGKMRKNPRISSALTYFRSRNIIFRR